VLAMERSDISGAWQLPQGGLLPGEDIQDAAWRELREETGLSESELSLEAVSSVWIGYELPQEMRRRKTGRGQVHKWFLFRMKSGAELPAIPDEDATEFRNHEWLTMPELADRVVVFRQPVYKAVMKCFPDQLKG
jgi:putative (di)nucleoside polyphosphate hydrolase